jgi:hypothetical protein
MTLFIAFMVYTERRIGAGRWDILCCVMRPSAARVAAAAAPPALDEGGKASLPSDKAMQVASASATPLPPVGGGGMAMERREADVMLNDDDVKGESVVKKFFRKCCEFEIRVNTQCEP